MPSDIIAFAVFCRLRYRLTRRDLSEIMLLRGFTVSPGDRVPLGASHARMAFAANRETVP
jgi:hypothetical protein